MPHISDLYLKVSPKATYEKGSLKEVPYELDNLLVASPASASVLDIMAASGSRHLPKEVVLDVAMEGTSEVT